MNGLEKKLFTGSLIATGVLFIADRIYARYEAKHSFKRQLDLDRERIEKERANITEMANHKWISEEDGKAFEEWLNETAKNLDLDISDVLFEEATDE